MTNSEEFFYGKDIFKRERQAQVVDAEPDTPLLYALRNDLSLMAQNSAAGSLSAAPAPSSWMERPFARA